MKSLTDRILARRGWKCVLATCAILFGGLGAAWGQDRSARGDAPERPSQEETQESEDFEEIALPVPNLASAGRILRDLNLLKAKEGIPAEDGKPRFDTEKSTLYFRTSKANLSALRKLLARIEAGDVESPEKTTMAIVRPGARESRKPGHVYALEIWLVQLNLPKEEVVELAGPRAEVVATLQKLEKESKAEILNHISLTAEEGKSARSTLGESVATIGSIATVGGFGGFRPPDAGRRDGDAAPPGAVPPGRVAASVNRQQYGTQVKFTPQAIDGSSILVDYSVSKTFSGKEEEGTLIPTDTAGNGYRQPTVQLFEVESTVRAPLGAVVTASSQQRGGEKPSEIRVLVLANPL